MYNYQIKLICITKLLRNQILWSRYESKMKSRNYQKEKKKKQTH